MKLSLPEYLKKENNLKNIDTYTIYGDIPIWRIVRSRVMGKYLNQPDKTVGAKITLKFLVNILISFIQLTLIIIRHKHSDNIIFPHPRLFKVGDKYIERLSDPIIDYSDIGKSYLIFERWQNGIHHKPRIHSKKCRYWDFVPFTSLLISKFFGKLIIRKYRNSINGLTSELKKEFEVSNEIQSIIKSELACFIISYRLTSPIIKACSAKRVFLAPRSTFNYVIAYGKKNGLTSYELQHGITLGSTKLYSGKYNKAIDPDYFLTFGKDNVSEYFGIPIERIKNVGYAYGHYINTELQKEPVTYKKRILIISEPQITEPLLQTVLILANKNPDWEFDFRCHPQEALNKDQKDMINNQINLHEVSNIQESFSTINKYPIIVGENSSVIFEALFLGKRVGRINFNGLRVNTDSAIQGGIIINSIEEFDDFINKLNVNVPNPKQLYSEFKPEIVNNLE